MTPFTGGGQDSGTHRSCTEQMLHGRGSGSGLQAPGFGLRERAMLRLVTAAGIKRKRAMECNVTQTNGPIIMIGCPI